MISKLLSTAVKLYLRSQAERVEHLQVQVIGKNKQILTGYIPQVLLSCSRAVYQGLCLSQIELEGSDIGFNLPEVLKKKPLKLLEPVFVDLRLKLDAADLQTSLDSSLLQSGLCDLWQIILTTQQANLLTNSPIEWNKIAIANRELNLVGAYQNTLGKSEKLCLSTKISLADKHTLCLSPLKITGESFLDRRENELKIDLGMDVAIEQLTIEAEQIVCSGKIRINN